MPATTSVVRRTKQAKLNALIGTMAIKLAKEANDPLYARFVRARSLWKRLQEQIIKKYRAKATKMAREALMSGRKK